MKNVEDIKKDKMPVIIFGAGIVGEALYKSCKEKGIKVECFTDNNLNKTKSKKCGIEVIHPSNLKYKFQDANFLISTADIKDVVNQLEKLNFSRWYAGNSLLKNFDMAKHNFSAPNNFVEYAVNTCILCQDSYLTPNKLFLRSADIIITERCSLKCKNCSNLMQYYQKPENCDSKRLDKSLDAFCNIIDEINEFRVIGGEPFMNKDFDITIKRLENEPKVKKIIIYTNGTIAPNEDKIEHLKNDKIFVFITDYGKLSRNIGKLTKKLLERNIDFYVQKVQGWTDCSKIEQHYRNIEQQQNIFERCCAKNTFTISEGKLYRCPFSANAFRLKAVPDYKEDYIDFLKETEKGKDIYKIKKEIKSFIIEKDFLKTCDYCNGRSFGDAEIQPAVQIDKPLEYKRYQK